MGLDVINQLAKKYEIELSRTKFNGIYGSGIIEELVSEDFPRIRTGIGKPIDEYDTVDYVIGKLEEETYQKLEEGIKKGVEGVVEFLMCGIDNAMNKFN